jgi:SAM-dependent methyltransferase
VARQLGVRSASRSLAASNRLYLVSVARFDHAYEVTPPWDIGRPQPALVGVAEAGGLRGRVLDAGCGTGEHALMAAARGFDAIGIDEAPRAIDLARAKAEARGLSVRFLVGDVLELPELGDRFDTVLDCGCFHSFDDDERRTYVMSLAGVLTSGGRLHLLCFSDRQPGSVGPRRVTRDELSRAFADGWSIDSIEPAILETNLEGRGMEAWLASFTRA